MSYNERMMKVIDYIGANLDGELTLDELSRVSFFSAYHFHRLFTAYTGLSVKQFIKWLRLKRAAHQLVTQKDKTILHIALDAGFETHESFTRAFKKICGQSPNDFRQRSDWSKWNKLPYSLPKKGEYNMNVTIKELPARRLAVMEHRGDPRSMGKTVERMIAWTKAREVSLLPKEGNRYGFAYDDPNEVKPEDFHFDLCTAVPDTLVLNDEVKEGFLPAGRYASIMHKGSRENIGDSIYPLYREWLPESGEEPADLPCIFCFHNFDSDVAHTELLTEILVLLK